MSIIDLSKYNAGNCFDATICVIGSGPGGAFAAVELATAGYDVLIAEAGGSIAKMDASDSIDSMFMSGKSSARFGFSRQLGGSSNLWAGRVATFEEIDFEKREWVSDSGWPINLQDLFPYYQRSAEIMGIPYPYFQDASLISDPMGLQPLWSDDSKTILDLKRFIWVQPPFNTGDYIQSVCKAMDGRLRILINARVRSLDQDSDTYSIKNAVMTTVDGRDVSITARYFVLAAGGVETPRILLNSISVCREGLGNQYDNVGRYFTTHPKADLGVLVLNKKIPIAHPLFKDFDVNGINIRYGIRLSSRSQEELRGLNHYVQLTPMLEYHLSNVFETLKGNKVLNSPFVDRSKFIRGILPGLGLMAYEGISRLAGIHRWARLFMLRAFLDQYPNRENRISSSSQLDRFGDRKVDLNWKFSTQDQESVFTLFSELDREFRACGLGYIESSLNEMEEWPLIGVHSHFMGTTRMGDNPKHAVVDKNCQVFDIKNLFISGPSTFPMSGYANPFFTIAALSLRLADHIKQSLKSSS